MDTEIVDTEIELKFFVSPLAAGQLAKVLAPYRLLEHDAHTLTNVYFDTPDRQLRRWQMGLRVRTIGGEGDQPAESIQTIKVSGKVVGGLHQRPEYNVATDGSRPKLTAFPDKIWPSGADLSQLQRLITPMFSTNFQRSRWLVETDQGDQIEVAFDEGEICTNQGNEPICEVELELVAGDADALFNLAREIAAIGAVRLANISKALRGYRLAEQAPPEQLRLLSQVQLSPDDNLEQALMKQMSHALDHWQYHEQRFMEQPDLASLRQLQAGVMLLQQTVLYFQAKLPELPHNPWVADLMWLLNKFTWLEQAQALEILMAERGHYIRKLPQQRRLLKKLQARRQQFPDVDAIQTLLSSPRYAGLMVELSRWLNHYGWREDGAHGLPVSLDEPVVPFARQLLTDSWEELRQLFFQGGELKARDYLRRRGALQRNLMVGLCFGSCFAESRRTPFRTPWIDILSGIEDLELLEPVQELLEYLEKDDRHQVVKWLKRKRKSLLHAIRQSQELALTIEPYWL